MNHKNHNTVSTAKRAVSAGLLLAALLAASCPLSGWSQTPTQDKAKGEEMLRRAQADLLGANILAEAAVRAAQAAQKDQEMANQKRLEARRLQREGFLLLHDSNRMQAAELRAEAETKEAQVKGDMVEMARLVAIRKHDSQTIADVNSAAMKLREIANRESTPEGKAELNKMVEALSKQTSEAAGEGFATERRIVALQAEIDRLNAAVKQMRDAALRLAPMEK